MKRLLMLLLLALVSVAPCVGQVLPDYTQIKNKPQLWSKDFKIRPGVDVSASLSAALNAAANASATLVIAPGKYLLSTPIAEPTNGMFLMGATPGAAWAGTNTPFDSLTGAVFEWTGANDADIFTLGNKRGNLQDFSVIVPSTFTGTAIRVVGTQATGGTTSGGISKVGIYHRGWEDSDIGSSTAIKFDSSASQAISFLWGWRVSDVYAFGFNSALRLNVADTANHWINGNIFTNILTYQCWRTLELVASTTAVDRQINGNSFINIQAQPAYNSSTESALHVIDITGRVFGNSFINVLVWDALVNAPINPTIYRANTFISPTRINVTNSLGVAVWNDPGNVGFSWDRGDWLNRFRITNPADPLDGSSILLTNNWSGSKLDAYSYGGGVQIHGGTGIGGVSLCAVATGTTYPWTVGSLTPILSVTQAGFARIHPMPASISVAPGSVGTGSLYVNKTTGTLNYYNGTTWIDISTP